MSIEATDWSKPIEVSDVDLAFPARGVELVPKYDDLPKEFRDDSMCGHGEARIYFDMVNALISHYHCGDPFPSGFKMELMEGVVSSKVDRHFRVVVMCYGLKHEHKVAGAAWLLSQWMKLERV